MSENWLKTYSELKEYIAENPKIKIGKNIIAIPGDIRPEFYRLFGETRVAFLREMCQTLLDEAILLSSNYVKTAQEIKKILGLSEIKVPDKLNWFLSDPENGLIRSIYDLLFDLLKEKIDTKTFEREATESIEISFRQLFQPGYEKWVAISLVNLLAPDRALSIPIEDVKERSPDPEFDTKMGFNEERLPRLKEMKRLLFGRGLGEYSFILSNLIVHSTSLKRYVSIGTDLADATWTATEISSKREWHRLREQGGQFVPINNWPDLVIYIDDKPEDIALVADFGRFCRPDIIVECMEQVDWYQNGGLEKVRNDNNFLKPRLGSYIVSRLPVPEQAHKDLIPEPVISEKKTEQDTSLEDKPREQVSDIHILTVGYDQSQLAPVIDALLSSKITTAEFEGR
jgi:hypothetical protein